jgi:hypothetical protein
VIVLVCTGGPYAKPCQMLQEGCRAVLSVIEGVVDSADETMSLFNCGVSRSVAELMGR